MNKQLKQFTWEIKVLDEANRIIEMIGSTEDYDRVGDKMFMSGADLTNYKNNPVIIANHNYGYTEKPSVIGRALDVNIVGSKMIFKIQFAETDNGKEWFYLYSNKYMNASSIGFIPKEYKPNDQGGYDFTKWELLELSMVAVPCNPNAVQRAFDEGKISKAFFDAINKNNEEDIENMKVEEVQALIDKAVESKANDIKKNYETELSTKTAEITKLSDQIKDLEGQIKKGGAAHSKATVEAVTKACDGITEHVKCLKALVDVTSNNETDGDGDDADTAKDYSEEEIQKMVAENVEKLMKGAK
ncbi:HK97 family phage prohead protease [Clostridium sp.]|uniref:HK97 family phage prohead protease n=1 Tax=Clostridium sp. TaxID=1506 RepID=UPI00284FA238|nr:HK97 family phage prohead protease [Clostridium sp.]MDR3595111.1 HK97 family phage prohead protease [Clostridium sp.]